MLKRIVPGNLGPGNGFNQKRQPKAVAKVEPEAEMKKIIETDSSFTRSFQGQ